MMMKVAKAGLNKISATEYLYTHSIADGLIIS